MQTSVLLNTNINGPSMPLKSIFMFSIMVVITGTPTGTLTLQGSNDPETNDTMALGTPEPVPTHWATIANSSISVTAAGNNMYNISDVAYNYVRVVYTDGSSGGSTATMTSIINGKGI